eukprot:COSAG01_NODE_32225_length_584_cov_1.787629_1_plen_69_part_00
MIADSKSRLTASSSAVAWSADSGSVTPTFSLSVEELECVVRDESGVGASDGSSFRVNDLETGDRKKSA